MKLAVIALVLAGCAPLSTTRVGRAYPPNAPSCQVRFEDVAQQSAYVLSTQYELVGTILVRSGPRDMALDEPTRESVRARACELGGDRVAYAGVAFTPDARPWDEGTLSDFGVYRRR